MTGRVGRDPYTVDGFLAVQTDCVAARFEKIELGPISVSVIASVCAGNPRRFVLELFRVHVPVFASRTRLETAMVQPSQLFWP